MRNSQTQIISAIFYFCVLYNNRINIIQSEREKKKKQKIPQMRLNLWKNQTLTDSYKKPINRWVFYRPLSGGLSIYFVKSWIDAPVDANILDILFVDGQRG